MTELIPCKTCKKEVSPNAKFCPHCGENGPAIIIKSFKDDLESGLLSVVVGVIAIVILIWFFSKNNTKEERSSDRKPTTYEILCSENYKLCTSNKDIMNLNRKVAISGGSRCKIAAEEKAQSEIDWGGFLSQNFSYFEDGDSGIKEDKILLIDKIGMHGNEFGGKIKKKTFCTYNIKTNEVEDIKFY